MSQAAPIRLGLLAASPVPSHIPLYRRLAADPRLEFTAIFASTEGLRPHDGGYAQPVVWDTDLLGGYRSVFLRRAPRNRADGGLALRDPDVVSVVRRGKFDILWLHGYMSVTHVLAVLAQRTRGGALLFREEQTLLHPRPLWKTLVKHVTLRILFHDAGALYVGTENRRWFTHFGVSPDRLFFAPYAVDNDRLRTLARSLEAKRDDLRASFGLRSSCPVILFVGRLIEKKQPLFLLEVFKQVRQEHDCALLVVGSGPLEIAMREKVALERIPDVIFAGFRSLSEVPEAYAAADVFALLSRDETWGLVVNEAMNFGLPIVVTDSVGSARDLVLDDVNGYVVDARAVEDAARRLGSLVADPKLRSRLGTASRQRIVDWNYQRAAEEGVIAAVAALVGPQRWSLASPSRVFGSPNLTDN